MLTNEAVQEEPLGKAARKGPVNMNTAIVQQQPKLLAIRPSSTSPVSSPFLSYAQVQGQLANQRRLHSQPHRSIAPSANTQTLPPTEGYAVPWAVSLAAARSMHPIISSPAYQTQSALEERQMALRKASVAPESRSKIAVTDLLCDNAMALRNAQPSYLPTPLHYYPKAKPRGVIRRASVPSELRCTIRVPAPIVEGKSSSSMGKDNEREETDLSTRSPRLRHLHKLAERKRRQEMSRVFQQLRETIPAETAGHLSKWDLLMATIDYLDELSERKLALLAERQSLRSHFEPQKM